MRIALLLSLSVLGCSGEASTELSALPPLTDVPSTLDRTVVPSAAFESPPDDRSSADPGARAAMIAEGFAEHSLGAGEPHLTLLPPGIDAVPAVGTQPKLLVRFGHISDVQLTDDESPSRVAALDGPGALDSAFRPQEADGCRVLNAAVRSFNAYPIAFVLTGGDNIDNAQGNELDWFLGVLAGRTVECDSGADDDPTPGPDNDPKDPFAPVGLRVPWYWVTGNHDVCVQGNFVVEQGTIDASIGATALTGTRDWSARGAPVVTGPVGADPRRAPLVRSEMIAKIGADGDGHGIGDPQKTSGRASYSFDRPDSPLTFVVLDTAAESGGAPGVIHRRDVDAEIRPMLDRAKEQGRLVVLASHHSSHSLGDGGAFGGTVQADALSSAEWLAFLSEYPNIVFSMVGHSHTHRIEHVASSAGGNGWWEILTSALADYPQQVRIVEIWDQDNGWLMLRTTDVDFATDGDPIAEEGRRLGILDRVSGWWGKGTGELSDRNVELWIPKPR